jgi:nitrile hydratase
MRRAHDLGGASGYGPVQHAAEEPVFKRRWEARVFGLSIAMGYWRKWSIDQSRHQRELIPGPDYLAMTYYERWFAGLSALVDKSGLAKSRHAEPALKAQDVARAVVRGPKALELDRAPRFAVGQAVRTKVIGGPGHTRLPLYAQDQVGTIAAVRGGHILPDASAAGLPPDIQPLYSVRFAASELFGEPSRPGDSVHLDLFESYLDPA